MSSTHELDFSTAIARAKDGCPEATEWIYEHYLSEVESHVRRTRNTFLKRHYDTVDLTQSVFVELLRDLGQLEDRGDSAFRSLLRLKARSKVFAKFRKHLDRNGNHRSVPMEQEPPDPVACPVEAAAASEARVRLDEALVRLEPRRRQVVRLRTEDGLSYSAIAERLGYASPDAVRMQYARALLNLQAWIKT